MRNLTGISSILVSIWAVATAIFIIYTTSIGFWEPRAQRSIFLLFVLSLLFLIYPARPRKSPTHRPSVIDLLFIFIVIVSCFYSYWYALDIEMRFEGASPLTVTQVVLGCGLIVALLEAIRRAVTPVLAGLAVLVIAYLFTSSYMPGVLHFHKIPFKRIVELMYLYSDIGIFGTMAGVAATLVAIFIAFGAFMEGSGLGDLFTKVASRACGKQVGGTAKVAVVTAALFGTMSGTASANVFTTGTFTIPMMKKSGIHPEFAGGVEAASGVGGQIMPPIMGAGAFVMAQITGIPYIEIIKAAVFGAICYFFMLLVSVHFYAKKHDIAGLDEKDMPRWGLMFRDIHLIAPVIVLLVLLLLHYSPAFCAFWSIVTSVAVCLARKHTRTRIAPTKLFKILVTAGYNATMVSVACVGAGIIVAGLTYTGLAASLGSIISSLSHGYLALAGGLLLVVTIVMGMGMPTTAAYIVTSAVGVPLLIGQFDVPILQANLFIFYFSILADVTPPVSIASYAAASIAKSHPLWTGVVAFRVAIGAFIVGYGYLYTPAIVLNASPTTIILEFLLFISCLTLVSIGFFGYFKGLVAWPLRPILVILGVALALTGTIASWERFVAIIAIFAILIMLQKMRSTIKAG